MQWSTNIRQIKAAIWHQAFTGRACVSCPMGRVVAIRRRKGRLQAIIVGGECAGTVWNACSLLLVFHQSRRPLWTLSPQALVSPHLDRPIPTSTDQGLPIRAEHKRSHRLLVVGEGAQFSPARQVPHLDRLIYTSTDQGLPIRAEHKRTHITCVADKGA